MTTVKAPNSNPLMERIKRQRAQGSVNDEVAAVALKIAEQLYDFLPTATAQSGYTDDKDFWLSGLYMNMVFRLDIYEDHVGLLLSSAGYDGRHIPAGTLAAFLNFLSDFDTTVNFEVKHAPIAS